MKNRQELLEHVTEVKNLNKEDLKSSKGLIRYVHDPFLLGTKKRGKLLFSNNKMIIVPYSLIGGFKEDPNEWIEIQIDKINDISEGKDWITLDFTGTNRKLEITYTDNIEHEFTIKGIKEESINKIREWEEKGEI